MEDEDIKNYIESEKVYAIINAFKRWMVSAKEELELGNSEMVIKLIDDLSVACDATLESFKIDD